MQNANMILKYKEFNVFQKGFFLFYLTFYFFQKP